MKSKYQALFVFGLLFAQVVAILPEKEQEQREKIEALIAQKEPLTYTYYQYQSRIKTLQEELEGNITLYLNAKKRMLLANREYRAKEIQCEGYTEDFAAPFSQEDREGTCLGIPVWEQAQNFLQAKLSLQAADQQSRYQQKILANRQQHLEQLKKQVDIAGDVAMAYDDKIQDLENERLECKEDECQAIQSQIQSVQGVKFVYENKRYGLSSSLSLAEATLAQQKNVNEQSQTRLVSAFDAYEQELNKLTTLKAKCFEQLENINTSDEDLRGEVEKLRINIENSQKEIEMMFVLLKEVNMNISLKIREISAAISDLEALFV